MMTNSSIIYKDTFKSWKNENSLCNAPIFYMHQISIF